MIDISKILAGWISSWVENDLGGFCLGGKWLKIWVEFGGWKMARWILDGWISSTTVSIKWAAAKFLGNLI